ncbi:hypothetical protein CHS0354_024450 [Potamilus streckersoni]|uniref:G-protein coupled receptors family 1 profile domain-containing protein n=1 Tax=Potamilus streckersoni TaxID=2493646 RepID=A0AAE0WHG0_9BIVA|nr:hypothetical protein CHS0354_024450 [Potamilus streckersoni]
MEGYYPYNISFTNMEFEQLLRNSSFNDSIENLSLYTVPTGIVALLAFLYGSISLLSVLGNGIVIFVIVRNKRMQTVTNIFIANLALADVVIGLFATPFQFQPALHQRWDLPKIMCFVAPSVKILSVSVSVFTLAVISIDRYVAVMFPLKAGFSKKIAAIVLGIIWILGLSSSIPEFLYFSVHMRFDFVTKRHDKPFCEPDWPLSSFGKYYHLVLFIIQYILPLIVINYSYFRIACRIWGNKTPGLVVDRNDRIRQRNKRKIYFIALRVSLLPYFNIGGYSKVLS